ncbi:MAG: YqhA family protein [Roseibium sp.]
MADDVDTGEQKQVMDPVTRLTRASQIPLLIGMAIGLILFLITYFVYIFESVQSFEFLDRKKTILLMLNLLDMVFIANLVIMIATNTYNTFRIKASAHGEDYIQQGQKAYRRMKHRIVSTIIIISSIHVLSELLEFSRMSLMEVVALLGFHLILLATYVVTNVFTSAE